MLNSLPILSKTFEQLNKQELYALLQLRMQVFCVEQSCAYQDIDGLDQQAQHVFIEKEGSVCAYVRILPPENKKCHIGRIVVNPKHRKQQLATKIVKYAANYCQQHYPQVVIEISAQSYLSEFYKKLDFESVGDFYLEDDIPHELMQIKPK